jgi:hypothetical protein
MQVRLGESGTLRSPQDSLANWKQAFVQSIHRKTHSCIAESPTLDQVTLSTQPKMRTYLTIKCRRGFSVFFFNFSLQNSEIPSIATGVRFIPVQWGMVCLTRLRFSASRKHIQARTTHHQRSKSINASKTEEE